MPLRFRCLHCQQLLSIATRKAGQEVDCPMCGQPITVPLSDEWPSPGGENLPGNASEPGERHPFASDRPLSDPQEAGAGPLFREGSESVRPDPVEPAADASRDAEPAARRVSDAEDEGLVLRRPETDFEEMDLTPMVDVTFLLLIFFMITASFSLQKTLEVPPPDPEREGAAQSVQSLDDLLDDSIKVEIDPRNTIFVDDERLDDPARLADALRDRMRLNLKTELLLDAHEEALHETVVGVVDAANEAGLQKIRMVARTGRTEP